ncbi:MAG: hypothetical protein HY401_09120 [Elusimicrobia bacterium]|nr:hypothetical protein [Elusimicrobiota bacterium]
MKKTKKTGKTRRAKKTDDHDDCKHVWASLLAKRGNIIHSAALAKICLECGLLKIGQQTIKISKNRLDMGNLPITNVLKVLIATSGRLKVPVGTNLYD